MTPSAALTPRGPGVVQVPSLAHSYHSPGNCDNAENVEALAKLPELTGEVGEQYAPF